MKNLKVNKVFNKLGIEVVGIKAVGDYQQFVTENFIESSDFYNPITNSFRTYKERYIDMLNKGAGIYYQGYLIFSPGFECAYETYAVDYLEKCKSDSLLNNISDISNYSMVKAFLTMCKNGILSKENVIDRLSKYFNNSDDILKYLV